MARADCALAAATIDQYSAKTSRSVAAQEATVGNPVATCVRLTVIGSAISQSDDVERRLVDNQQAVVDIANAVTRVCQAACSSHRVRTTSNGGTSGGPY